MTHFRTCKKCKNHFTTEIRYARMCPNCAHISLMLRTEAVIKRNKERSGKTWRLI